MSRILPTRSSMHCPMCEKVLGIEPSPWVGTIILEGSGLHLIHRMCVDCAALLHKLAKAESDYRNTVLKVTTRNPGRYGAAYVMPAVEVTQ
jgi:hypothetical protein